MCQRKVHTLLVGYDHTPEFATSIDPERPAARHAVSLLSRERFWFMLRFGIAFVEKLKDGVLHLEKHVMRYPQLFASLRLRKRLDEGMTRGTIWHTQGSGKTALTYHTVKSLTEYYTHQGIVPRFFFVVDRIDLANQADDELTARGLRIVRANSREEFDTILNRGKPSDEADAARMLRELQGRTHCVCTAVAVYMPGGERRDFAVKSYVRFRRMSAEDIRRYLSEVYVLDKAGAYAMQEKSELIVESVEGDVDNVIGLPVRQLLEVLRRA